MNLKDLLWLSFKDLNEKRIRTALTVMMVVIGVAAIVALTAITAGVSNSISASLSTLGPTSIIVTSTGGTGFGVADVASVSSLPNVSSVTPALLGTANIYAGNQNTSVTLIGISSAGLSQLLGGNTLLYAGSVYQDTITPDALLGHAVAFPTASYLSPIVQIGQPAP